MWIDTCIVIYVFCLDYELKIEVDQLKDRTNWEKDQNQNIETNQVVEHISISRKRARQTLVAGKKIRKYKKH